MLFHSLDLNEGSPFSSSSIYQIEMTKIRDETLKFHIMGPVEKKSCLLREGASDHRGTVDVFSDTKSVYCIMHY